jgi:hypothetical protein
MDQMEFAAQETEGLNEGRWGANVKNAEAGRGMTAWS